MPGKFDDAHKYFWAAALVGGGLQWALAGHWTATNLVFPASKVVAKSDATELMGLPLLNSAILASAAMCCSEMNDKTELSIGTAQLLCFASSVYAIVKYKVPILKRPLAYLMAALHLGSGAALLIRNLRRKNKDDAGKKGGAAAPAKKQ